MELVNLMDPRHRRRQNISLFVGYALVGCAIMLLSVILLFMAFGFGYKNGQVIQSGLLFISSLPRPAGIYIDGKHYKNPTNTRLILQAGTYDFDLKRAGYRDWRRSIDVVGGQVESFTYPFLFPLSLTTSTVQDYVGKPTLVSQSPDQRWLMVMHPASYTAADVYDLNNPAKAPAPFTIPSSILSAGTNQSLAAVGWANDNNHLLVQHAFDGKTEFLLLDRDTPDQSINLSDQLAVSKSGIDIRFDNGQYDHYFILDTSSHVLYRGQLHATGPELFIRNVLTYETSGNSTVLYVAPDPTDTAKVLVNLYDGNQTYTIRQARSGTNYLLAIATYQGDLYVAVSASSENTAFVYENPVSQLTNRQLGVAVPVRVMSIEAPDFVSFSASGQYVMFENGQHFAVYDTENQQRYAYTNPGAIDQPQLHASWMDSARLQYTSQGQLVVFDYDGLNRQTVVSQDPAYVPAYDNNYKIMYGMVPAAADRTHELLTSTPLRAPADQ